MSILLVSKKRDFSSLKAQIHSIDSNIDVQIWPAVTSADRVQFAVAWNQPENIFSKFPNLKAITSLGAGVDHLTYDQTIPKSVAISRMVIPSLKVQISDYVLMSVLNILRNTHIYFNQQRQAKWAEHMPLDKEVLRVGIMGLGELGSETAKNLARNGFSVSGWAKSYKEIPSVQTYTAQELNTFLNDVNILVCLLPLTPETEGILNLETFKKLRQPAFIINIARGEHLVDEDLIYALDTDLIQHSTLDIFTDEPLPESHPFWNRKNITITPHTAALTNDREAAELIVDNYKRILSGMDLTNPVNRELKY
jgi:glyoxylate/hydroxypyruvate reductase A